MKKYFWLLKANLSLATTYRFELYFNWIGKAFAFYVYYILWSLSADSIEEKQKLLVYFLLFHLFFELLSTGRTAKTMSKMIRNGEVNNFLLKPINFQMYAFLKTSGTIFAKVFVPTVIFIIFVPLFPSTLAPENVLHIPQFLLFVLLGVIMWNLFMANMGNISFWGTEIGSLLTVIDLGLNLLKGSYIPFYLYPNWLQELLFYTPLNYMGAFQISIYQSSLSFEEVLKALVICGSWILFFYGLNLFTYKKALKAFDALGG